jgi:DNA-binding HxlR family transcriptional regulator
MDLQKGDIQLLSESVKQANRNLAKRPLTAKELVEEYDGASLFCPYTQLLEALGKPHTLQIIYVLQQASPWRFTQIQKILNIQPKTLAARLQELLSLGLVTRRSYNEIPPRVDYELTQKGKDIRKIFDVFGAWADKYPRGELRKKSHSA